MCNLIASFPGSPSFHAIIPCMTFDPPKGKALFLRWVKGHTWNYCVEGGRAWERGYNLNHCKYYSKNDQSSVQSCMIRLLELHIIQQENNACITQRDGQCHMNNIIVGEDSTSEYI